jgi:tRNA G10  N-methylase Trm11
MKNSPWRGTYDAVVTDPPYNIRTHLLKENKENILDPSIPHSEFYLLIHHLFYFPFFVSMLCDLLNVGHFSLSVRKETTIFISTF